VWRQPRGFHRSVLSEVEHFADGGIALGRALGLPDFIQEIIPAGK